jgi:hypothetical protein
MPDGTWILGDLFTKDYGHRGSIQKLWEQRWKFPCTKSVYPFHDGALEDFEPIFQHLIAANINDPYADAYTNAFLPTARRLAQAAAAEHEDKDAAIALYLRANALFRIARFPYIGTPLKHAVFLEQKTVYLAGAALWDNPIREVTIPHAHASPTDADTIAMYLRLPPGPGPFPVLLLVTGLDGHRPDNTERSAACVQRGWAVLMCDIPGTPDCAADRTDGVAPDRLFTSIFEYIEKDAKLDAKKVAAWGLSAGGYYAIRLAHTHAQKLVGSVGHGAGSHYYIGSEWLSHVSKHEYPFGLEEAYVLKYGYRDFAEVKERCQDDFSLISSTKPGVAVVGQGMPSCMAACRLRTAICSRGMGGRRKSERSKGGRIWGTPKRTRWFGSGWRRC